jgi:dTDP-4-dehydrorhamnose reductase
MRRILIIGARGMLGQDLAARLRSSPGAEVVAWDIEEIDIRVEKETVAKIGDLRPDMIFHLAAFTQVDACESEMEKAFAVNAEGTKHVAQAAVGCGAKVVFLSTDYVFDGGKKVPYREDDPPHPINVYGQSKWQGELYLQRLSADALIVRTQWLYGRFGSNFVTAILRQAKEKGELQIVTDQTGSPTYTVDLANVLSALAWQKFRGVFHVVNSGSCTWYEFGRTILRLAGLSQVRVVPVSSEAIRRPARRPSFSVLSCQKLKERAGLTLRPWQEALEDYLISLKMGSGSCGEGT